MECLKLITVRTKEGVKHQVPCGKCAYCLVNKRTSWMFRIHHEMRTQNHRGYFLTFTYDERHVCRRSGKLSLRFRDIQLYIKRLRKAKYYVKYVCVGEYGGETHRPHYHMLLWTDASCDVIQSEWKSSKDNSLLGSVHFGELNMRSAMYALKYIIQPKQKVERDLDGNEMVEKTRAQFSKGIGLAYLTTQVYDYHTFDYNSPEMFSYIDGMKVVLPRYYRSKIFTKYQMAVERVNNIDRMREAHAEQLIKWHKRGYFGRAALRKINEVRIENARLILLKTKHGTSL